MHSWKAKKVSSKAKAEMEREGGDGVDANFKVDLNYTRFSFLGTCKAQTSCEEVKQRPPSFFPLLCFDDKGGH